MARRRDEWGVGSFQPPKANGNGYAPTAPLLRELETPKTEPMATPAQTQKPAGQTSGWGGLDTAQSKPNSTVAPRPVERSKEDRDAFDVSVRENYARNHPEATGGTWGARMREVNGQMVDLAKSMEELDEAISRKERALDVSHLSDPGRLPHSITQAMDADREALKKLKEQKKDLQAKKGQAQWLKTYLNYEALRMRPDFWEKSAYRSNRGEERREDRWWGTELRDTGYVDVNYDSINGDSLAATLSGAWPGKHYEAASKDVAEIFNYLYETQGRDAAYAYMDHMGAGEYSGADVLAMGLGKGLGLGAMTDAVTAGGAKFFGLDEADGKPVRPMGEIEDEMLRQDPELFGAGNVAGSVMLARGLAKAVSAIPAVAGLSPAGQAVAKGSAAWGGSTAIHELGDVASGELGWGEYGKDVLVGVAALDDLAERTASLRDTLNTTQYVGYDRDVTRARTFLDWMDDALDTTRRTYRSSSAYGFSLETQRELERLAAEMYRLEGTDWDVPVDSGSWTWGPGAQEVTVPDPALGLKEKFSAQVLAKRYDIEYTDSPRYQLLETYVRSVEEGRMSSKVEFPMYEDYHDQIQEWLVGQVVDGVEITGQTNHFLERVFGCEEDPLTGLPRDGVELEDLFDCLENPVEIGAIKTRKDGKRSFVIKGRYAQVSINPDTGVLIQVNRKEGVD